MPDLREQLQQLLRGRVCLVGLGNVDYGDDGFGVRLAEGLAGAEKQETITGSVSPGEFNATFPLAPALSLRERENHIPSQDKSRRFDLAQNRATWLPLPKGEGWGEGKGNVELGSWCRVLNAGSVPERFIGRVADEGFDHVIFLDAVEFGGAPGSVVLLNADEMAARFPQISTHKLSLGLLARQLEANGRSNVWLLGVQPESLRPGARLSPTVSTTLELLLGLLRASLKSSSRGNEALTSPAHNPAERENFSLVASAATTTTEVLA